MRLSYSLLLIGVFFISAAYAVIPAKTQQLSELEAKEIKQVNEIFGTTLKSTQEVSAFMIQQLSQCYEKIRTCTPGEYRYAIPDPITSIKIKNATLPSNPPPLIIGNFMVKGIENEKCLLEDHYQMQGSTYIKKCQLSQKSLASFTHEEAKAQAEANLHYQSKSSDLQKILTAECEISQLKQITSAPHAK